MADLLRLGERSYDISSTALVMGIANRTPDSFYDQGEYFDFDRFLAHVEQLVADGADLVDIGGVKAGPGPEVSEAEELDRVIPAVAAVGARFGVPVSVDTWRAAVAAEAYAAGAVVGNDISGFADPEYLPVAASAGATVIATHIRLAPRVRDPEPGYTDVLAEVVAFLAERAALAADAGIAPDRIVLDAGLDLGKTAAQSLHLLRHSDSLVGLGYPVLLSASNKTFLGALLDIEIGHRHAASLSAAALGIGLGCRILRVHDVAGTVRVRDVLAAILQAGEGVERSEPAERPRATAR